VKPARVIKPSRPGRVRHFQHGAAINYEIASADYLIAGGFGAMLLDPLTRLLLAPSSI
jgi:hypothetical protein